MTQEEKAKAYDMALEAARKELGCDRKEWEVVKRVLHNIFPELAESEDELVRNWLLVQLETNYKGNYWASKAVAWLEKQKENPKNADSIPADCTSLAKCEDRDSKYGVFPEDVIVVARACEKLEAHGYPELAYALKNVNLYTKPVDYDHEMWKNCEANFEGGKKEVIDHPEKYGLQKEQKPAATINSEPIPTENNSVNIPLAEWSEEDEKMIDDLIRFFNEKLVILGEAENAENTVQYISYKKVIAWLKSLRPQWKPTEEQMEALQRAIDACESEWAYQDDELRSLLNDLKKLM